MSSRNENNRHSLRISSIHICHNTLWSICFTRAFLRRFCEELTQTKRILEHSIQSPYEGQIFAVFFREPVETVDRLRHEGGRRGIFSPRVLLLNLLPPIDYLPSDNIALVWWNERFVRLERFASVKFAPSPHSDACNSSVKLSPTLERTRNWMSEKGRYAHQHEVYRVNRVKVRSIIEARSLGAEILANCCAKRMSDDWERF